MYKKIKLYFINRRIREIYNEILDIKYEIKWIKEHTCDKDLIQAKKELEYLNAELKMYNMELNSYKQDKEKYSK